MKRYQIALLFFALGIFAVNFFVGYFYKDQINSGVATNFVEYSTVKVYFSNSQQDPGSIYCDRTYPVYRDIPDTIFKGKTNVGEAMYFAIEELLNGPTGLEKNLGFFTSINAGTKVQNILVDKGVAQIDFNDNLNEGVAGSCRVQAISSQIAETLKQFPEVSEVIISVNGNSQTTLQP